MKSLSRTGGSSRAEGGGFPARLLESEDRFRIVVESAPNGIIVSDNSGRIVLVNRQAEKLFGYSREEFLELSIEDLVPERLRGSHGSRRENFQSHPEVREMGAGRDLYAMGKDGREFPVEIALTPLPAGDETLVLSSVIDITERKKSEDDLLRYSRELEETNESLARIRKRIRFQAEILGNVHDAVFYVSTDGKVREWNEGAERIFGFTAKESVGRTLQEICLAKSHHPFEHRIVPAVEKHGIAEELIHCRTSKGREIYVRAKATRMSRGEEQGYVICASDMSKEKELEAELLHASENEQRRIGQDLHDDLCSQLSGIGCLAKVLEQQIAARGGPEAESVAHLSEMIASAGVKAREIARGLVPAALETRGLRGALEELAARQRDLYGVDCRLEIACEEAVAKLDRVVAVQVYRIIQEAVANAVKHSDAEGITIALRSEADRLTVSVSDDGKGLILEHVTPGLGLLTMRRRAELIGAEYEIETALGEGTEIRFSLLLESPDETT